MKRAIVTGPTGVIGTALVKKLIAENIEIYAVIRSTSKRINTIPNNQLVHIIKCDIDNLDSLKELIQDPCDAFFHLAWAGTENPLNRFDMQLQTKNIQYSLDAVQAAIDLKCQVFVGAGSQAEYGIKSGVMRPDTFPEPVSGYGMSKLCAGQMTRYLCKQAGIRHIWPRILSVYGPGDGKQTLISSAIRCMLAGEKLSMTAGEQLWDYLYSADAADALYAMAEKGKDGAVYVLGSGKVMQLREYVEIIRDIINPNLEIGFGERPYFKDQVMHLEADISSLTNDTGWAPKIIFYNGVSMLIKQKQMFKQGGIALYKSKKKFNICPCLCKQESLVGGEYCA